MAEGDSLGSIAPRSSGSSSVRPSCRPPNARSGDSLTSDELIALGREVGIPGRYLQQALLEERTRLVTVGAAGLFERVTGPGQITAQRVVRRRPGRGRGRVCCTGWSGTSCSASSGSRPGRITWEPIGGIQAAIRRSTAALGGGQAAIHALARGHSVGHGGATGARIRPRHADGRYPESAGRIPGVPEPRLPGPGMAGTAVLVALGALLPLALLPAAGGARRGVRRLTALWPGRLARSSWAWSGRSTSWNRATASAHGTSCPTAPPAYSACWRTKCEGAEI